MTNSDIYEKIKSIEDMINQTLSLYDSEDNMTKEQYGGYQFLKGELLAFKSIIE